MSKKSKTLKVVYQFKISLLLGIVVMPVIFIMCIATSALITKATIKINRYTFSAPITSLVESVNVKAGDRVLKNQLLLTLNAEDLMRQKSALSANIYTINSNHNRELKVLQQSLLEAKKSLSFQSKELGRYKDYQSSGVVSLIMLSSQMQNYSASKQYVDNINSSIIAANISYQQALYSAQEKIRYVDAQIKAMSIYTRESGVVSQIYVTQGQPVIAGANLISIDSGYNVIISSSSRVNSKVKMLVGKRYITCSVINISNNEKSMSLINSTEEKIQYYLDCPSIDAAKVIDNKHYYVW